MSGLEKQSRLVLSQLRLLSHQTAVACLSSKTRLAAPRPTRQTSAARALVRSRSDRPPQGVDQRERCASIAKVGELEPRPADIHLDPSLANLQPVRALKPALVIGKASLGLPVCQAFSPLRRLRAKGALSVGHSAFESIALDLANALIPDAGLRWFSWPLPQLLDDVRGRLDPRGGEGLGCALVIPTSRFLQGCR